MSAVTRTGPGMKFFILSHLTVALVSFVLGAALYAGGAF